MKGIPEHTKAKRGPVRKKLPGCEESLKESDLIPILEGIHKKTGYRILGYKEGVPFEVSGYSLNGRLYREKDQNHKPNTDNLFGEIISAGSMTTLEFYLEGSKNSYDMVLRCPEGDFQGVEAIMKNNIEHCVKEYFSEVKGNSNKKYKTT